MKPIRSATKIALSLALVSVLGACATDPGVTRNAVLPTATAGATAAAEHVAGHVVMQPKYDVTAVHIAVPHDLRVSEANVFYPIADIVWRGERRGDRYAQVQKIFEEGFARGTKGMAHGPKVVVNVEVERFHILTEKAKLFTGGTFDIHFLMTVKDVQSGAVLDGPRIVVASMKGVGGQQALDEEARGLTQRVKIVAHLAEVARAQLSGPVAAPAAPVPMSRGTFTPSTLW